jgi:hypothetical protein
MGFLKLFLEFGKEKKTIKRKKQKTKLKKQKTKNKKNKKTRTRQF